MKKRLLFSLLLLTAALTALADANEVYYDEDGNMIGFSDDAFFYLSNGNEATVGTFDLDHCEAIEIPATVICEGVTYTVTAIGDYAFSNNPDNGLKSVTIPNTVTSIGRGAFNYCHSLSHIDVPNSVIDIAPDAFDGTPWYDNQPDGLVYVAKVAFKYKGNMPQGTSITIKDGTLAIGHQAFYQCDALTSLTIPNSVTTIGGYACYYCTRLKYVNIPNSVTRIGYNSFSYCYDLDSLFIPSSVTEIGITAFMRCKNMKSITVDSNNAYYDSRDNCNAIIETSSNTLIAGCKNTIIPNTVTAIGDWAFNDFDDLLELMIPNSVTYIGEGGISCCDALTRLIIPNSVTAISMDAFYGSDNLRSVIIGNSVSTIRLRAFEDCFSLRKVTCIANTPPILEDNGYGDPFTLDTFDYGTLYVPHSSLADYKEANQWKRFAKICSIGDVNGDEQLSISDVVDLIDGTLAGSINYDDNPAADMNSDGVISIADIVELIDQLLNSNN